MNKFLLITILLLLSSPSLFAFNQGEAIFYPTAGIGGSTASLEAASGEELGLYVDGDPTLWNNAKSEWRLAWNLGVAFDYFLNNNLALTSGLLYESRPFRVVYHKNTAEHDIVLDGNFTFFTIPLGLKYYTNVFYFGGGLYYSILLSNETETKYGSNTSKDDLEEAKDDFGVFADIGLNFNMSGDNNLLIFARYQQGLVKVYTEEDIITDIKLRAVTLNISYGIKF